MNQNALYTILHLQLNVWNTLTVPYFRGTNRFLFSPIRILCLSSSLTLQMRRHGHACKIADGFATFDFATRQKAGHANFCQTIAAVVTERRSELNMSQRQEFEIELTRDIEKHFDMKKIHQLLRMVPLFEPVLDDDNLLTLLASRSEIVRFDQGETIVRQWGEGEPHPG